MSKLKYPLYSKEKRKGFTLLELIVTMVIIALLTAFIIPNLVISKQESFYLFLQHTLTMSSIQAANSLQQYKVILDVDKIIASDKEFSYPPGISKVQKKILYLSAAGTFKPQILTFLEKNQRIDIKIGLLGVIP